MTTSAHGDGVIVSLRARIEALPLRRRAAKRVGSLSDYSALVGAAAEGTAEVRRVRECVRLVFRDASMEGSGRGLAAARARATALLAVLNTPDDIEEPTVDRGLADLRKAVQTAKKEVQAEWRGLIEAVSERYGRLVNALHDAGVQGSGTLRAAVERVERMDEAPTSRSAATHVANDISAIVSTVRDLGLEGPVGEFLTAAADKGASAEVLRHSEVLSFLDKHDLWGVLVVALK